MSGPSTHEEVGDKTARADRQIAAESARRNDILERAWNTIRLQKCFAEKAKTIEMVCRIKKDVPERAIADAPRIVQVLTNLISNAIKFVPEGHGSVKMTAGFSDEMLTVSVSDNGRGISEDGLSRLFRPFSQAEGEGAFPRSSVEASC